MLPKRAPIVGEEPGSFDILREGMIRSLMPFTPYECVIAENLVAIEWELLQRRQMRDASLRKAIQRAVREAVTKRERKKHETTLDAAWDQYVSDGGKEDDWEAPFKFDAAAATRTADDLLARATAIDRDVQEAAYAEIVDLGLAPIDLMSEAYHDKLNPGTRHDEKIQELERRRRKVKRDFDVLQKVRPMDGEVVDA